MSFEAPQSTPAIPPTSAAYEGNAHRNDRVSETGGPGAPTFSSTGPVERSAPIAPGERIVEVDILRGFALFGVLLLNLLSYSGPTLWFEAWAGSDTWWDRLVETLLLVGGQAAFYSIFSFLFGLGVALQMHRAAQRSQPFKARHLSRMAVLFLFGTIHAFVIWDGDILMLYAVAGSVLLLFARSKATTMLAWAAGLGSLFAFSMVLTGVFSALENPAPTSAAEIAADIERFGQGGFVELTRFRLDSWVGVVVEAVGAGVWFVPLFLTGMWTVASGRLFDWRNQRPLLIKILKVSLPIAIVVKGIYAAMILSQSVRLLDLLGPSLSSFVGGPALGVSFTCLLFLAFQRGSATGALRHLAPVGRMALTNYLMQSVAAVLVFYGFGLGLYGQIGIAAAVGLGIVFFGFQVIFSALWLKRFRFGPMEWLWRTLTYRGRIS